ncbi:MAG: VacB/RNase II family 3'-5' exoribonuclease, partial [Alphaproteobacteria bacterium]|nr:VacB/RNase II family 3'-5' exoribonuclease [Alphaproteobacteria bacterium]
VCARPDSADNPGGMEIWVAIADVAFYVTHGSPLDLEARERGNSVYLPDRVIPMLPESLSNGACSLLPNQERAVMVALMRIDSAGKLLSCRFESGVIHSRARLTYEQVQAVMDGAEGVDAEIAAIVEPLQAAYRILLAARLKRHALDLELPERQVRLDPTGQVVQSVGIRPRLEAHRLIEEMMILANIAAAEVLESQWLPCIYRVHDRPSPEKFVALSTTLASFGYRLDKGQGLSSELLVRILNRAAGKPEHDLVHGLILRSQSLAIYSPENIGHFGLALARYAHFTSPIRRYADLMVHRYLKLALKLGREDESESVLNSDGAGIARHISAMERRAVAAERGVKDRLLAAFLAASQGAEFTARVSSVTKFGLFVTLDETGADGLVPISSLPNDYYRFDVKTQRLVGDRSRRSFRLGERLLLTLDEVEIVTGRIKLSFVESLKN